MRASHERILRWHIFLRLPHIGAWIECTGERQRYKVSVLVYSIQYTWWGMSGQYQHHIISYSYNYNFNYNIIQLISYHINSQYILYILDYNSWWFDIFSNDTDTNDINLRYDVSHFGSSNDISSVLSSVYGIQYIKYSQPSEIRYDMMIW